MADDDDTQKAPLPRRLLLPVDALRRLLPEVQITCVRFGMAMRKADHTAAAMQANNAVDLLLIATAALQRTSCVSASASFDAAAMRLAVDAARVALKDLFTASRAQTSDPTLYRLLGELLLTINLAHDQDPPPNGGTS